MQPIGRTMRRRGGAALVGVVLIVALSGAAGEARDATGEGDLTRAEAATLAEEAIEDRAARRELRSVSSVEGRPFDAAPLSQGTEQEQRARLGELAALFGETGGAPGGEGTPTGAGGDAAAARTEAEQILDDDRFHERDVPRPFRGVLRWMGDRLSDAYAPIERLLAPIFGAGAVPYVVLAAFFAGALAVAHRLAGARSRAAIAAASARGLVDPDADPIELDRLAERASERGDLAASVRLRHEAGLLRLMRGGRLALRPDMTARDAADAVASAELHDLTDLFEEVVYGGRPVQEADLERSIAGWRAVLGERVG